MCHKDFSRNRYLKKHIKFCKGVINRLQCEYCEKEFKHENSRFRHYKTCATKKEMALIEAEEDKVKIVINNSGQTNNLTNGIQNINNNTNNNIIIVYNPAGSTPFSTDHLKAEDFKKILKLASTRLDNRALVENEGNRCIKKTNIKSGHSQIHVGDNKWKLQVDKNIYPQLALDMANHMSEYVDKKRETFKKDMYIRLRDFVDCMCDAGYMNSDPTAREKELQREFKTVLNSSFMEIQQNHKKMILSYHIYQSIMNKVPKQSSAGKRWTVEEENCLVESMNRGTSIEDIAKEHNRTVGAIKSRIKKKVIRVCVVDIEEMVISSIDPKSVEDISAMVHLKPEEIEGFLLQKKEKMTPETYTAFMKDIRKIMLLVEK